MKKPFLSFNCEKILIYFAIYWILDTLLNIPSILGEPDSIFLLEDPVQSIYSFVILSSIGDLLSGFLVLYVKKTSKRQAQMKINEEEEEDEDNKNLKIYNILISYSISMNRKKWINRKENIIKLILIGFLEYIGLSLDWIAYAAYGEDLEPYIFGLRKIATNIINTIARFICSTFILKKSGIYKHNLFSLITILIGLIILFINEFFICYDNFKELESVKNTIICCLIPFLKSIIFPIEDTLISQFFINEYLYPEQMQFIRGLIESIIIIIVTPILSLSFDIKLKFCCEYPIIIFNIFFVLLNFFNNYIKLKLISHFSVQCVSFLIIFRSLIMPLIKITNNIDAKFLILHIIGTFIIMFSLLVYDEIIIINKCGLNHNVKRIIQQRASQDMKEIDILLKDDRTIISPKIDENDE